MSYCCTRAAPECLKTFKHGQTFQNYGWIAPLEEKFGDAITPARMNQEVAGSLPLLFV